MAVEAFDKRPKVSTLLPDFPWDTLTEARLRAASHPDGIVDLSVGTPVDPTPACGQTALVQAANSPGYPLTWGTPRLREAIRGYLERRWASVPLADENVLPAIGTKELVAWLPTLLGVGPGDTVVVPSTAYPTYAVGALLAGASVVATDDPSAVDGARVPLVWINSPANPHGAILSRAAMRAWVKFARASDAVVASDECYGEFCWDAESLSVLNPHVNHGDTGGVLAVHSLSKRSNLAGYRAGFVAGDESLVTELLAVRKHLGMMVPEPVQAAMAALLDDQTHVEEQRGRYLSRRHALWGALEAARFRIEHSEGSLYLWATRDEDCRATIDFLADRGILAAPGDFYGSAGKRFVRIALTATDERVAAAVQRLTA